MRDASLMRRPASKLLPPGSAVAVGLLKGLLDGDGKWNFVDHAGVGVVDGLTVEGEVDPI